MRAESLPWLLEESEPSIRYLALTDLMGKSPSDPTVPALRSGILRSRPISVLKRQQMRGGIWPPRGSAYVPKFTSTVWQLMLLGELAAPRTPWIESSVEFFFRRHQMDNGAFCCGALGGEEGIIEEPCLSGNMLRTLCVLGYGDDTRVKKGFEWLPEQQLEDGGWNCDYPERRPTHSSFMSTIEPLWAYSEIPRQRWTRRIKNSIERGSEFLLQHRVYKSHRSGKPVEIKDMEGIYDGNVLELFHFPMYYYYDVLHGLRVLTKLGYADDERIMDGIELLLFKARRNGTWLLDGDWVRERKVQDRRALVDLETLGRPSKWVTLNCYRVLKATGDLDIPGL